MDEKLHKTIQAGDLQGVEDLLKSGANINYLFGLKGTPLCAAIYENKEDIVDLLLKKKCDINAKDYDGEPPLCLAVRTAKYHLVERLLKNSACDVNKADPVTGRRPIHVAIINGHFDTVKKLVESECLINATDRDGNTPINTAMGHNQKQIVKYLVDVNCNLDVTNAMGEIPLLMSLRNDIETMRLILDKMKLESENDERDNSYLNYQTPVFPDTPLIRAVAMENMEAACELIKRGCDVNAKNANGQTALYVSCKTNNQDMACILLEAGANPNAFAEEKRNFHVSSKVVVQTPMKEVISLGNLFLVKKLIEHGADLNCQFSEGVTPLCFAFLRNKAQIADYILDVLSSKNFPLFQQESRNLIKPLLFVASCTNPAYFAKRLLDLGGDVNYTQRTGNEVTTPLLQAVEFECHELCEVLLDHGADAEIRNPLLTPLQVAASEGSLCTAAVLIQYGAEINAKASSSYDSPVYFALSNGNTHMVAMLLECGCDVHENLVQSDNSEFDLEMFCTDDEIEYIQSLMQQNATNPLSLKFICRNNIKSCLLKHSVSMSAVSKLGLPSNLENFIRHKDLDRYKHMDL